MKTLTLFFLLLIGSNCSAQEPVGAMELLEMNILYRGYTNKVIPAVTNNDGREISVSATNASISKEADEDYFIVKPGNGKTVKLTISLTDDNGKIEVIKTIEYRVTNLPVPYIYWCGARNGSSANIKSTLFFAKYPPEIPLNASFKILHWKVEFEGNSLSGEGSNISTAEEFLKEIPSGMTLVFEFAVLGSDGITRMKKGQWKVNSWEEETEDSNPKVFRCG